jgi:hypothetical protein
VRLLISIRQSACPHASTRQFPEKNKIQSAGFYEEVGVISAFYRIFGQSFESLKLLDFENMRRIIGKTTFDLWRHKPCGATAQY